MRPISIRKPAVAAAVPAAVVGSIALLLTAPPAAAAVEQGTEHRVARTPKLGVTGVVVPQRAPSAVPAPPTYTVQRGDTVFGIATRHALRTADVLALNGLTSASIIRPGQVLRLVGSAPAPAAPAAPVAASGTYTVVAGDTLSRVAKKHGVTVQALFAANGLGWSSIIYPGQKVRIPGGAAAPAAPAAPTAPAAPVAASGTHTVVAGDTLSAVAKKHGVTVQALFAANGLGWSSIIYPGQKLKLPGAAAAAPSPSPAPAPAPTTPAQAPVPSLDAEQVANVQLIIRIGRELGVPDRGIAIALGAAMQESSLRNLGWGDRDSLGLFQQRPSTGWGTEAQVQDPARATRTFFGGRSDPNGWNTRGLLDIPGWQSLTFTQAAQAVQVSAYPDLYARWETAATTWLAQFG